MEQQTYGRSMIGLFLLTATLGCAGGEAPDAPVAALRQALNEPAWTPGVSYALGAAVTYGGIVYNARQAHTSAVGWEPPGNYSLWQRPYPGTPPGEWRVQTFYPRYGGAYCQGRLYAAYHDHVSEPNQSPCTTPSVWFAAPTSCTNLPNNHVCSSSPICNTGTCQSGKCVSAPTAVCSAPASAPEIDWASYRDLSSSDYSDKWKAFHDDGYLQVDFDAYPDGSNNLFSMVWQKNTDGRDWAMFRSLSDSGYMDKWTDLKNHGFRPTVVEGYRTTGTSGSPLFGGIWVENREGLGWYSYHNLTPTEFQSIYDQRTQEGYRLVNMDAFQTSSGLRYTAVWYENRDGVPWVFQRDLDRTTYQQKIDTLGPLGYRVADFASYTVSGTQRYAAIWVRNDGNQGQVVRSDRSDIDFHNLWREYRDKGYRLVDQERYQTSSGPRYAGVWVENNSRYRYGRKDQLDSAIESYRTSNSVPGISVAVVQNGQTLYRRGFGFAEQDAQKQAHGGTVYLAASVSKVIGGTLAAKLASEGKLRDGTPVSLNLDDPASTYIPGLPAQHTQTVKQLLSRLGCIWDYGDPGEITPPAVYYPTALDALKTMWNAPLVSGCTIGALPEHYSTHALTFAAAAIEQAAGRPIARLVREEIAERYGLGSMRAMFETSPLVPNDERAAPYDDAGNETTYADKSWKVLGGGMETSAVDLALFGWKTLNGEIVSAATRDNLLWAPVIPGSVGLAWAFGNVGGRATVYHTGTFTGARAHLRIYRNDGTVVAVMSNKAGHDPSVLTTTIGDLVLAP